MPTIEELFKSKKLVSGQTAEQQYDIRNTADLRRTPYNVLMTPSFRIAEIGRRNVTNTKKETRLEEELSGLRILSTTSSPFIYGTDIFKFTTKSRGIVDDMKGGANGVVNSGILGTFLNKAENLGKNLLSKIGVKLPEQLIPSRIVLNKDFIQGSEYNTIVTLTDLKSQSGGNFFGKLLANNLQGRPNENQLIGSAIDVGKKALNTLLLGSPSQAGVNFAKAGGVFYDSISPYGKVMLGAHYLPEDLIFYRTDLSSKYVEYKVDELKLPLPKTNYIAVPNVIKNKKTKFSTTQRQIQKGQGVVRGMTPRYDYLNTTVAFPSTDGLKEASSTVTKQLDDFDFVPLKFWSVAKGAAVNFRATINGLSETLSPSWDPHKFIGNPFNFYTYNGIERSVTFNFKVYSLSSFEHKAAWQRLNFLTSLVYPQQYRGDALAVVPPFIKFTLGDMFRNKEAFIESLTYTVDDSTPWEIGMDVDNATHWKLPKIISVDITLKLVETRTTTYQKRLYGYGGVDNGVAITEDKDFLLNIDGSPIQRTQGKINEVKGEVKKDGKPAENPAKLKPGAGVLAPGAQPAFDMFKGINPNAPAELLPKVPGPIGSGVLAQNAQPTFDLFKGINPNNASSLLPGTGPLKR